MMGSIVAVILILAILIYLIKNLLKETDYQTWLNILLVTVIMLTVIMSIFMLLNKTNTSTNTDSNKGKTAVVQNQNTEKEKPSAIEVINNEEKKDEQEIVQQEQKEISEMTDDELSLMIAENYLTLKNEYESRYPGKNGANYASNKIIEEYGLTNEEWQDLYNNRLLKRGFLKQAEQNLKK